ncbi:MAG: carboxypeptidase regulatory-like domain-containing protein, partial [Caldilineae bacterium]
MVGRVRTDERGLCRFLNIERGAYGLFIDRGVYRHVEYGESPLMLEVEIPANNRVRGRVVTAGDVPVPGARVFVAPFGRFDILSSAVTEADAAGRFEIEGVALGSALFARAAGHGQSSIHTLSERDRGGFVVLRVGNEAGTVRFIVQDSGARAPSGVEITVRSDPGPIVSASGPADGSWLERYAYTETDESGRAVIEDLDPGRYSVRARAP